VISKDDVINGVEEIDIGDELFVITKDFTNYYFEAYNYQIINDTLYGSGTVTIDSLISPFKGSIPLQKIMNFEQNETDTGATILLFAGIISIGLIILAMIGLSDISDN
jgi:hypothetical protein